MRSLDHFVVLVEPLEPAIATYQRLGFHTRPIAKHAAVGSANSVIHFDNTYLELFTLGDAGAVMQDAYRPRLSAGEGLTHVSVTSDDLEEDVRTLQAAGLETTQIWDARREIVLPDGRKDFTASRCFYAWRKQHRYLSIFRSIHPKPEAIFIPQYVNHANTAWRVTRCVFVSEDPATDLDYFETLYEGSASDRTADGFLLVGARGDISEVITWAAAARRYGQDAMPSRGLAEHGALPLALHYTARSIAACMQHLQTAEVGFRECAGMVIVPADFACGVLTVFEGDEQQSRL